MKIKGLLWIVLAAMIVGDGILEKKNKRIWEAVQLPANLFCGVLSLGLMIMMAMGVGEVSVSRTDLGGKAAFLVVGRVGNAGRTWGKVSPWKRWLDMKKKH